MQNRRTHFFTEGRVITGLLPSGEYGAYRDNENEGRIRGYGHTRLAAIADLNLNTAISDTDEEYDHRAAAFDHAYDLRKHEVF
jgi:hypothetical protein